MTFTDAELKSYLAGDAPEDMARAIEGALADDPALEERMMALDALAPVVRAAVDNLGAGRSQPLAPAPLNRRPLAVAASIAALGAAALWWSLSPPKDSDWMDQVAAYQALYSPDTIAIVEGDAAALAAQFAHVEAALDHTLPIDALHSATDLTLLRAQVLEFEGRPLAQVVFADDTRQPIALCLIRHEAPDAIQVAERQGLHSASFGLNGFEYLLIGAPDAEAAAALAQQFRGALASG